MNILCLHPYLSMRAVKQMAALEKEGHKVNLVYEGLGSSVENGYGFFWNKVVKLPSDSFKGEYYFRRLFPKGYRNALIQVIRKLDCDIIHTYSMPDTLAVAAIRYSDLPVIFDTRDLYSGMDQFQIEDLKNSILNKIQGSIYKKIIRRYEKEANEKSNGRVYVSPEMLNYVSQTYNIDLNRSIVLANYQTLNHITNIKLPKLSAQDGCLHLVYIGNIYFDELQKTKELIQSLAVSNIHLHMYLTGDNSKIDFIRGAFSNSPYVHFHNPLSPKKLSEELLKYDFGLVPRPPDFNVLNISFALPNKLFDYLAAGLPIAGRNISSLKKFIDKHQIGFTYNTTHELISNLLNDKGTYTIFPERFLMEYHISGLVELYEQVMN